MDKRHNKTDAHRYKVVLAWYAEAVQSTEPEVSFPFQHPVLTLFSTMLSIATGSASNHPGLNAQRSEKYFLLSTLKSDMLLFWHEEEEKILHFLP